MKVQIYSQWNNECFIHARVKQFTKAAKLMGKATFTEYAATQGAPVEISDRQAVANWIATEEVAVKVVA